MEHGKYKNKKMPMKKMMHSENEMGGMMKYPAGKKPKGKKKRKK